MIRKFLLCCAFAAVSVCGANIHVAGDSLYGPATAPELGLGEAIKKFCKPGVKVYNRAVGGRSTKSFIDEGRWTKLLRYVKPGDFVIIQFGHNDQKQKDTWRYADPEVAYPGYLCKMISDVRAKKASVVLATSVVRCRFAKGKMRDTGLYPYRDAVLKVAAKENVPVINMNKITEEKFNAIGEAEALKFFMYATDVPKKKGVDKTHLNTDGAMKVMTWFVEDCKRQNLPMAECFK